MKTFLTTFSLHLLALILWIIGFHLILFTLHPISLPLLAIILLMPLMFTGSILILYNFYRLHLKQEQVAQRQIYGLFQANPLPMMIYEVDSLRLNAVNEAMLTLYEYSEAELLQMTVLDIHLPDEAPKFLETLKTLPDNLVSHPNVWQHRTKDNRLMDVRVDSHLIPWNGTVARLSVVIDLTAQNQMLNQLERQEQQFSRLFEAASEGIILVNAQRQIVSVNKQIQHLFGYTREELFQQDMNILLPEALRSRHEDHHQGYFANPHNRRMGSGLELMAQHKDGHQFPVEISLTYAETEAGTLVMSLITDITVRKQNQLIKEEAERLNLEVEKERELRQFKNRFVSMFAHDFRTPLAVIMNVASILQRYDTRLSKDERLQKCDRILQHLQKITRMLDEVMALNRSDMGRVEFKPTEVDLELFCAEILDVFHADIDQEEHRIILNLHGQYQPTWLDKNLMHYVLTNLLSNAIKYSPNHKVIEWDIEQTNTAIIFKVRDYGIGIPEEEQPDLFKPFYRASNARSILGTGLGLVIVQEYVTVHGGQIIFQSAEGKGTTFIVTIPHETPPPAEVSN